MACTPQASPVPASADAATGATIVAPRRPPRLSSLLQSQRPSGTMTLKGRKGPTHGTYGTDPHDPSQPNVKPLTKPPSRKNHAKWCAAPPPRPPRASSWGLAPAGRLISCAAPGTPICGRRGAGKGDKVRAKREARQRRQQRRAKRWTAVATPTA